MRCKQSFYTDAAGWTPRLPDPADESTSLVLVFGSRARLTARNVRGIARAYPAAVLAGCSTSGEILGTSVHDDSLVVTAVQMEHTRVRAVSQPLASAAESRVVGTRLAEDLAGEGLAHVVVFSDGIHVNGSQLVAGLGEGLPREVTLTGGLAGDGEHFEKTLVIANGRPASATVAAVGFYGDRLRTGHGSLGGWDQFGPERLVTRSEGNVLYELDGYPALELYRRYLGPYAKDLPASALLFPLALRPEGDSPALVRTVLSIDDDAGTMTFAGDLPEGHYARLMKANFDRLLEGASHAASDTSEALGSGPPDLALLISCVGRRMVLKQRVEEEVEGVRRVLGERAVLTGFYSYGEISPFSGSDSSCQLHNQTMTITAFREV